MSPPKNQQSTKYSQSGKEGGEKKAKEGEFVLLQLGRNGRADGQGVVIVREMMGEN